MKRVKNPYLQLGSKFYRHQEPIHHWLLTLTLHGQVTLVARCDSSQTSVGVNYNLQRQLTVHTMCNPGLDLLLSEYLLQTMANEKKGKIYFPAVTLRYLQTRVNLGHSQRNSENVLITENCLLDSPYPSNVLRSF